MLHYLCLLFLFASANAQDDAGTETKWDKGRVIHLQVKPESEKGVASTTTDPFTISVTSTTPPAFESIFQPIPTSALPVATPTIPVVLPNRTGPSPIPSNLVTNPIGFDNHVNEVATSDPAFNSGVVTSNNFSRFQSNQPAPPADKVDNSIAPVVNKGAGFVGVETDNQKGNSSSDSSNGDSTRNVVLGTVAGAVVVAGAVLGFTYSRHRQQAASKSHRKEDGNLKNYEQESVGSIYSECPYNSSDVFSFEESPIDIIIPDEMTRNSPSLAEHSMVSRIEEEYDDIEPMAFTAPTSLSPPPPPNTVSAAEMEEARKRLQSVYTVDGCSIFPSRESFASEYYPRKAAMGRVSVRTYDTHESEVSQLPSSLCDSEDRY